jgi:DNA-binding NtrC family response regulator
MIADRLEQLDLVVTDYLMPSMTGEELIGRVRERHPSAKALIVTGHGDILDQEAPDWWTREAHLTKPFDATTLRQAIVNLIGPP